MSLRRRPAPGVVALIAGAVLLLWGLGALQLVLRRERDGELESLASRRRTLDRYAQRSLQHALEDRMRRAEVDVDAAVADPLRPARGLFAFRRGRQLLPRNDEPRPGPEAPARRIFEALAGEGAAVDAPEPGSPWAERLELQDRFRRALRDGRPGAVAATFREVLVHRQMFRIDSRQDIPAMLALLHVFLAQGRPDGELLHGLLHGGIATDGGEKVEDLARLLLRSRARFTAPDFQFLVETLAGLARRAEVPHEDFLARAREAPERAPDLPEAIAAPHLLDGGRWLVASSGRDGVLGVTVSVPELLAAVTEEMRDASLIGADDAVALRSVDEPLPTSELRPSVESASWGSLESSIVRRYRLKTAMVVVSAAMAAAVVALGILLERRRRRLVDMRAELVATVSHELRTPLSSIRVLAETLERRARAGTGVEDYPQRIVRAADRLSFMVENVLTLQRMGSGTFAVARQPVPVTELASYLADELSLREKRPVRVEAAAVEGTSVHGDPELLKLLFLNLGRNACQYNDQHQVHVRIEAWNGDASGTRILVSDNGFGLAGDDVAQAFTEFHRGSEARSRGLPGTGLGLAICRRIATLHGGTIRVASTSAQGTTFELLLP